MGPQAERRVGSVIGGKWRVDALLGSGSMAAVYAVTHRNGARAALKVLHPTLCADPTICERFLGEGYLTNAVKHPGIVRVLDDGITDDGCVFLLMDLLEGTTLEGLRQERGGRLEPDVALEIADKLMDALEAVHEAGIIHRDLKPQNVFVCDDGTVKLLDFGVARLFDRASGKLSVFGMVLGTPSFMSPEQARGSRELVDHRSDIWSLGATIFTAITGETVHLGPHTQAKILAAATIKPRSISTVMPDLPQPIAGAIDAALRFDREERWENIRSFRRALREARAKTGLLSEAERGGARVAGAKETSRAARRSRSKRATLIGVGGTTPARPAPSASDGRSTRPGLAAEVPAGVEPSPIVRDAEPPPDARPTAAVPAAVPAPRPRLAAQIGAGRSSVGSWLVALVATASAIGVVAWLAVERVNRGVPEDVATTEPRLTSASLSSESPRPAPPPIPTVSIEELDFFRDASEANESPLRASVKPPAPVRTMPRPAPPTARSSAPPDPAPARASPSPDAEPLAPPRSPPASSPSELDQEEPRPPDPAPDPFGTPD